MSNAGPPPVGAPPRVDPPAANSPYPEPPLKPGELGLIGKRSWKTWQVVCGLVVAVVVGMAINYRTVGASSSGNQKAYQLPPPAGSATTTTAAGSSGEAATSTTAALVRGSLYDFDDRHRILDVLHLDVLHLDVLHCRVSQAVARTDTGAGKLDQSCLLDHSAKLEYWMGIPMRCGPYLWALVPGVGGPSGRCSNWSIGDHRNERIGSSRYDTVDHRAADACRAGACRLHLGRQGYRFVGSTLFSTPG